MSKFPWGKVIKVHQVGDLAPITEYIVGPGWEDSGKTNFSICTASLGTQYYDTFDDALIGALCDKYAGPDTAYYVCLLLEMKK